MTVLFVCLKFLLFSFKGCGEGGCARAALHSKELLFLLPLLSYSLFLSSGTISALSTGLLAKTGFWQGKMSLGSNSHKMGNRRWLRQPEREGNSADPKQQQKERSSFPADTFLRIETEPEVLDLKSHKE